MNPPNKQGAAMNKIKRAAVALALVAGTSIGATTALGGTASALQSCQSQRVTQTWSDAWCYDGAGPIHSIQAYAICIWPGQPNGIRQTVRGAVVYSPNVFSNATCPSGKVVYANGYSTT